jgi:hypothetical protein
LSPILNLVLSSLTLAAAPWRGSSHLVGPRSFTPGLDLLVACGAISGSDANPLHKLMAASAHEPSSDPGPGRVRCRFDKRGDDADRAVSECHPTTIAIALTRALSLLVETPNPRLSFRRKPASMVTGLCLWIWAFAGMTTKEGSCFQFRESHSKPLRPHFGTALRSRHTPFFTPAIEREQLLRAGALPARSGHRFLPRAVRCAARSRRATPADSGRRRRRRPAPSPPASAPARSRARSGPM